MPYVAGLSEHADAAVAVGEAIGQVLDVLGPNPDVAVLFVSGAHVQAIDHISSAVRQLLKPAALTGTTAVSVVAGAREVEGRAAIALWAGNLSGWARSVRIASDPTPEGGAALDDLEPLGAHTLLLLADPYSFPVDGAIDLWSSQHPELQVIGGLSSAAHVPRGNRLLLDDDVYDSGAVGVLIGGDTAVEPLVSQGCRPIGDPLVITEGDSNLMRSLAGKPALERLQSLFEKLSERDKLLVNQGLHIGRVIDEHKIEFTRGDFLIRAVMGADQTSGAVLIGEPAQVGATVQFQVRDADSADADLRELLGRTQPAEGALLFTCNGRGSHLFEEPNHDAILLGDTVSGGAVAGMFCAGEIGPVGGRNFVHGFTASAALFRD